MSSPRDPRTRDPMDRILALLRAGLHLTFAVLLGLGLASYALPDPAQLAGTAVLPLATALAATYAVGTVWESLHHAGRVTRSPARFAPGWLTLVTLLWCGLVASAPDFVWVLFPLVLLTLHILPRWPALATTVALWGISAFVPRHLHPADWSTGAALGPAVGTVIAVAIFAVYRTLHSEAARHRRVAQQLRATQAELAATEHEAGRMEERERLSREIHDTVAQGLSSILLVSRAAQTSLKRGDTVTAGEQLGTIGEVAAENLAEARRFVRDLASPSLGVSLPAALQGVVESVRARQEALGEPLSLSLQLAGDTGRALPEPVGRVILRAAQEALNNVVRHAHARRAVVTFAVWEDTVTLDVVDDGGSFDGEYGYGLRGLAARVAAVNGKLDVLPGDGTTVVVSIPLTSAKELP